jgi:hypothetical protein
VAAEAKLRASKPKPSPNTISGDLKAKPPPSQPGPTPKTPTLVEGTGKPKSPPKTPVQGDGKPKISLKKK